MNHANSNSNEEKEEASQEINPLELIDEYVTQIHHEFDARWSIWPLDLHNPGPSEVIAGLLRRQLSLTTHLVKNPGIWTPEFAPIIMRCMIEVYIWLAWILIDPVSRCRKYIDDGLGKEKLYIKHRTDEIIASGGDPNEDPLLEESKNWVESQRYSFLIDVNLGGSWSGLDTRKMAEEAGCQDFYRFTYPMFSMAVHSSWNHVSRFDLGTCKNPLHAFHRVPSMEYAEPNPHFFILAAKYMDKTFCIVDEKLGLAVDIPSTYEEIFVDEESPQ